MKNNNNIFIKYLDGQLSPGEIKEFENSLDKNQNLKMNFEKFSKAFQSTKNNIEVDERYFQTLLPNARERMHKGSPNYFGKLAYVLPMVLLGVFVIYLFNTNTPEKDVSLTNISELLETNENLSDEELKNVLELNRYSNLDYQILEIYFDDSLEMDETLFEYLESNLAANEISNSFLEELSENEFSTIYKELENIKIVGKK